MRQTTKTGLFALILAALSKEKSSQGSSYSNASHCFDYGSIVDARKKNRRAKTIKRNR